MSDSPIAGGRSGVLESPVTLARTRSGSTTVRPQPVTEQSLMESVAGERDRVRPVSHWSSSDITALSLVTVMLSYVIKNQLKAPKATY